MRKTAIIFIQICLVFSIAGYSQKNLLRDIVYVDNKPLITYNWINIYECNDVINALPRQLDRKMRIYPDYRNLWKIRGDSLFLFGIKIGKKRDGKDSILYPIENKMLFFNCFSDSLCINTGQVIRNCYNCEDIREAEIILVFKNGVLISKETFINLQQDSISLKRHTENEIKSNLFSHLTKEYDWEQSKIKKDFYLSLILEIDSVGKTSKITFTSPVDNLVINNVKNSILRMHSWQKRYKHGIGINEKFNIQMKFDNKNKKIFGSVKYIWE